ncbi:MAG: NADH-quinone oxidoreductase subunit L [Candidatus Pelagibacter sp.]|mgnify:FL=1|nr:NADH-quinone oxidoreductase subunit L [Candidatus Pelagibacter sp.]OUW11727.1 MAG: NADH-quinone oxidoreductase subunit L [Candidatus Pelagibacter sp. TMED166]|tara:strand:- start:42820 stop:44730 length:1911 start_codon:yes stop_codon:yes gene_type:complete
MSYVLVFAPLIGFLLTICFGKLLGDRISQILTSSLVLVSTLVSFFYFFKFISNDTAIINDQIINWVSSGKLNFDWSIYIDPLTSLMLVVITSISFLVHIYSIEYMSHDKSKPRFMAYLSFFTFAMIMLVTADNFVQLFFGWEGVGLASYLLIGFWYHKNSANKAAIKAFIVNRIGDFGLAIGIFIIYKYLGTLNYEEVFDGLITLNDKTVSILGIEGSIISFIAFFLFIGAMGKSAQIFLHTWLPDAMEGPTPVSALIHAATMVTAGVFLVVKCSPIFENSIFVLNLILVIGASTALFAATIALVQNDIKKVIAYSTCSQLGYMFVATGLGAYHIAMFHLFTHAFFKALLFLGAGSVIHSMKDEQDMRRMGGLWKKIPITYIFMIIGTLAITGFPFLSGFFSKDAIIEATYYSQSKFGGYAMVVCILTALLTAMYSWRLIIRTFHGNFNNINLDLKDVKDSGLIIILPLLLLSIGAVSSGFAFKELLIGIDFIKFWDNSIYFKENFELKHPPFWFFILTPIFTTFAIPLSFYIFLMNKKIIDDIKARHQPLYNFLINKWYFDEIYDFIFVRPIKKIGDKFWKIGDIFIIDGFGPNGFAKIAKIISIKAVKFQSGFLYHYAFVMLIFLSIFLTLIII